MQTYYVLAHMIWWLHCMYSSICFLCAVYKVIFLLLLKSLVVFATKKNTHTCTQAHQILLLLLNVCFCRLQYASFCCFVFFYLFFLQFEVIIIVTFVRCTFIWNEGAKAIIESRKCGLQEIQIEWFFELNDFFYLIIAINKFYRRQNITG